MLSRWLERIRWVIIHNGMVDYHMRLDDYHMRSILRMSVPAVRVRERGCKSSMELDGNRAVLIQRGADAEIRHIKYVGDTIIPSHVRDISNMWGDC